MNGPSSTAGPARVQTVSVVVCNYNGEHYLPECLGAIRSLEGGVDEVIVVDNASRDGSLELLRIEFPDCEVIALDLNLGPSEARNIGMRAARNRWVLGIDNDAVLAPDSLARLIAAIEANPAAVAAQPRSVFDHERERVHYDGGSFHYIGLYSLRNFCQPEQSAQGQRTEVVDGLIGIAILLDKDVVLDLGGYDESFFILFEDHDLSMRLRIAGHRCLSVEDARVIHRGGTPGISYRGQMDYPRNRAFFHSRNRWFLLYKNHSALTLLLSLPGIVVYELAWIAFTIRAGHLGAWMEGKVEFMRSLPSLREKRRKIQSTRRVSDGEFLVGGPLTLSPQLVARRTARVMARTLSGLLSAWWACVRFLVP